LDPEPGVKMENMDGRYYGNAGKAYEAGIPLSDFLAEGVDHVYGDEGGCVRRGKVRLTFAEDH